MPVYLVVYVDDILIFSSCDETLSVVVDFLKSKFEIKGGEPSTFVGVQIDRDVNGNI